jgi:hypothetical protein
MKAGCDVSHIVGTNKQCSAKKDVLITDEYIGLHNCYQKVFEDNDCKDKFTFIYADGNCKCSTSETCTLEDSEDEMSVYSAATLSSDYTYIGNFECADGEEIRMYDGDGDNDGDVQTKVAKCAQACLTKKAPTAGSWDGFEANGFIVRYKDGRCFCESAASASCKRGGTSYNRFDLLTQSDDSVETKVGKLHLLLDLLEAMEM